MPYDKSASRSNESRLKRMFTPKSKAPSAPFPAPIERPSRPPVDKNRSQRAATMDEAQQQIVSTPPSGPSHVRQRTDSQSSVKTVRLSPEGRRVKRSDSMDSVRTVVENATENNNQLRRADSSQSLDLELAKLVFSPATPQERGRPTRPRRQNAIAPPRESGDVPKEKIMKDISNVVDRSRRALESLGKVSSGSKAPTNPTAGEAPAETPLFADATATVEEPVDAGDLEIIDMDEDLWEFDKGSKVVGWSTTEAPETLPSPAPLAQIFGEKRYGAPYFWEVWNTDRFRVRAACAEEHTTFWDVPRSDTCTWWDGLVVIEDVLAFPGQRTHLTTGPSVGAIQVVFWASPDNSPSQPADRSKPATPELLRTEWSISTEAVLRLSEFGRDPAKGIHFAPGWHYIPPKSTGGQTPGLLGVPEEKRSDRGMYTRAFSVPIPTKLFAYTEYRIFRMRVSVVLGINDSTICPSFMIHSDSADVAVEHLRKEKHMDGTKLLHMQKYPANADRQQGLGLGLTPFSGPSTSGSTPSSRQVIYDTRTM